MQPAFAVAAILAFRLATVFGQTPSTLFVDEAPLEIAFSVPLNQLKNEDEDSVYFSSVLRYKEGEIWDSIRVGIRARGNFRRKNCGLPPLRIKISKENRKGLFTGVKSLKLVLPCQDTRISSDLLMKEYVCYQLYEQTSPYVLNTRLVKIVLTDVGGKRPEVMKLNGFLIEDDDDAARRFQAKVVNADKVNPFMLQDTCALRFDLFQFMIGNTDYSTAYFHNIKVMRTKSGQLLPVAYDFDMSGFVSAPYAMADASLGIENVRERIYRGFCRNDAVAEFVRREYLQRESTIYGVIDNHKNLFSSKDHLLMKRYMEEFFVVLRSDALYLQRVNKACRTK